MPAKAGIQTWPHVLGLWIPAGPGMTPADGVLFIFPKDYILLSEKTESC
jgi:hypothetical protein